MHVWRSHAMHTGWNTGLKEFNRLVMQYQDEAFCLAFYMLGNETQADQVVQSAVRQAYIIFKSKKMDFRSQILQLVCVGCLKSSGQTLNTRAEQDPLQKQLSSLPGTERLAVILIDLLGLSYAQAGEVMHQPPAHLRGMLTQGRLKLRNKIPPTR